MHAMVEQMGWPRPDAWLGMGIAEQEDSRGKNHV